MMYKCTRPEEEGPIKHVEDCDKDCAPCYEAGPDGICKYLINDTHSTTSYN